ncbi:hypothetical protein [Bacillus sp. 2205SS5-2]|uniref:hypothetical protein n=1 Tax=Bacillus sp. 2205SS5-2 TaxID=3109031 RepID=UPI0030043D54
MDTDKEQQIMDELQIIKHTLQELKDETNNDKPPHILLDIVRSLLIGLFLVGPAAVGIIGLILVIGSWLS